jgi:hypothetical protein
MKKSATSKIVIFEPDEEQLKRALVGRNLSPALVEFLKNLLKRKKWARRINIPSDRDDVAAVLVFAATLKEAGLEILSELHVYFAGKIVVEKWEIAGASEKIALLPKDVFRAIDISKVRVEGAEVSVEFSAPRMDRTSSETLVKIFDFSGDKPSIQIVPHPLLERD